MPKIPSPYHPDFTTETSLAIHLLQASWLLFLTTTLALLLLACALIFLLRLCVLWDRQLAREGFVGGAPREERLLRRCEERGRRICAERGVWDVGVRGWVGLQEKTGDAERDGEMIAGEEQQRGKKLRFLPVAEVIPPAATTADAKGKGRQRTSSHSSSLRTSDWDTSSPNNVTEMIESKEAHPERIAGEEPVLFFGGGSWIRRVRSQSERSGSGKEGVM